VEQFGIMQKINIIAKLKQEKRALEAKVAELEEKVVTLEKQKNTAERAVTWKGMFPGGLSCFRSK
tara:strand:+ start:2426 stop:2620 length:195 start_codon:yes stop_codon:yes gene_type:complete